jgi:lysozyme
MPINLKVLDISHYNTVSKFEDIYAFGIRGIVHKSSQGTGYVDPTYASRRNAVIEGGLLWGAYHFADGSDPVKQAEHFLSAAKPDEHTLLSLDFEPNGKSTMTLPQARTFLQTIERETGRKAVLYSGNLIKETLGDRPDEYFGAHRLWLAHYSDTPKWPKAWAKPWLQQFSGDGINDHGIKVPGVSGLVDLNSFDGSDEELAAQWAALPQPQQAASGGLFSEVNNAVLSVFKRS